MRGVSVHLTLDFCPDPSVVLLALSVCLVGPDHFPSFLLLFFFSQGRLGSEEVVNTGCEQGAEGGRAGPSVPR